MADRVNNPNLLYAKIFTSLSDAKMYDIIGINNGWVFVDPGYIAYKTSNTQKKYPLIVANQKVAYKNDGNNVVKKYIFLESVPSSPTWVWTGDGPAPPGSWYFKESTRNLPGWIDRQKGNYEYIREAYWIGPGDPDVFPKKIGGKGILSYKIVNYTPSKSSGWFNRPFAETLNWIYIDPTTYVNDYTVPTGLAYSPPPFSPPPPPLPQSPPPPQSRPIIPAPAPAPAPRNNSEIKLLLERKTKLEQTQASLELEQTQLRERLGVLMLHLSDTKIALARVANAMKGGYRKKTIHRRSIKHRRKTATRK